MDKVYYFIELFSKFIDVTNTLLYTYFLIFLLLICGIYFTIKTRFIQVRFFGDAISILREKSKNEHISPFGALMISTASRVGIGNIVGVGVAISAGGVGALFWMWITAIIGGASAFIESTLAQVYKIKDENGSYKGGPSYYIHQAIGSRKCGIIFAISLILCFTYGFNGLQAYTLTSVFEIYVGKEAFSQGQITIFIGIIIALLSSNFFFANSKASAKVSSILVPIMAISYLIVAIIIILMNFSQLYIVFKNVFSEAFNFAAIFGGFAGSAMVQGIKRGLFSNEAGMGSAPNAAAAAHTSHPAKQGIVQILSVFIDTLIICSASAFIILAAPPESIQGLKGIEIIQTAITGHLGNFGLYFISVTVILFAFTSIIGNYFYAESSFKFITNNKTALLLFRISATLMVFIGSQLNLELAWNTADVVMGIMATINIVSILILGKIAIKILQDYDRQKKQGKDPEFKAINIGLNNTQCWK